MAPGSIRALAPNGDLWLLGAVNNQFGLIRQTQSGTNVAAFAPAVDQAVPPIVSQLRDTLYVSANVPGGGGDRLLLVECPLI
jgi:hypothetical protein